MKLKLLMFSVLLSFVFGQEVRADIQDASPVKKDTAPVSATIQRFKYEQHYGKRDTFTQTEDTQTVSSARQIKGENSVREKGENLINSPENVKCEKYENDMVFCIDGENKPYTGRRTVQKEDNTYVSIENFKDGYKDGLCTYFNDKGQRKERSYYKQGMRNGTHKIYYSDNNIKVLTNYKDGLLDGMADVYLPDGTLGGRMKYKNGYLEKGYCKKNNNKKENFDYNMLQAFPYNTINDCGL